MKHYSFFLRASKLLLTLAAVIFLASAGLARGAVVPPAILEPLNQLAVPEPPTIFQYVKNKAAAIKLGKALFWDMQVGSDGMTACASCHFSAGTDTRLKNTVNPGTNAGDTTFQVRGPNQTLVPTDFPFHQRQDPPEFKASPVIRDSNDVVGSQGVRLNQFVNIVPGSAVDNGAFVPDLIFNVNGVNTRQVTGRNTPSVINAVFNFSNFWDGRASSFFNGSSPFGPLDPDAGIWTNVNGTLSKQPVSLRFASLASQATGPPLSDVEMSFRGRTFPQLGRKMLSLTPLGGQMVHPYDSELGDVSNASLNPDGLIVGAKGLKTTYSKMIRAAFQNNLWESALLTPDGFTQMEANFAFYWGLAIQLYEATLVSDDTPFDRFLGGDSNALTTQQQDGFTLFFGAARCDLCHGATETTNASVRVARFISNADHGLLEVMPVASGKQIVYDNGFNNTAVRPTTDDLGRGADSPFINPLTGLWTPLSFSKLAELQMIAKLPFATPELVPGLPANFPVANDGAFKVPGMRNVELTAPYMHDGSMRTLDEVVDFYARGGNFPVANKANLDINITELPALQGDPDTQAALVAFLKSMTDERVRNESAPFDHPELFVPNGDSAGDTDLIHLPATDYSGSAPPASLTLTPDQPSPHLAGSGVVFTADAGNAGYQFRFVLFNGTTWVTVQDFSTTPAWTLPASTPPGNYTVEVDVRKNATVDADAFATAAYQVVGGPATGVTVVPSQPSPQATGTPVVFTASGSGSGNYDYRFRLHDGISWTIVQAYGNGSSWTLPAATAPGSYTIAAEVRTSSAVDRDTVSYASYLITGGAVVGPATGVTVTPSLPSPHESGTPVPFTAVGSGSSGYQYRFWLFDGGSWSIVQDYGIGDVWTLPASSVPGNYTIAVDVRTSSAVDRDAVVYHSYVVTVAGAPVIPASGVTITPSQPTPHIAGSPVVMNASGSGSSGYDYRFWLFDGSGWSMVQNYGGGSGWTLPAATPAGDYTVAVDVRTNSAVHRDAVTYLQYRVIP